MTTIGSIQDPLIRIKPNDKLISFIASLTEKDAMPENILKIYQIYSGDTNKNKKSILNIEHEKLQFTKSEIDLLHNLNDDDKQNSSLAGNKVNLKCLIDSLDDCESDNPSTDNDDEEIIDSLNSSTQGLSKTQAKKLKAKQKERIKSKLYINLNDIKWLHLVLVEKRRTNETFTMYLHELLEDAKLKLPKNEVIERDPVLEARCVRLRMEQDARVYNAMTKNVDSRRQNLPEDTIAYQSK